MTISICILNYSVRSYRFEAHCAVCNKRAAHILTFLFPNAFGIPIKNRDRRRKVTKERRLFAKCSAGKKIALRGLSGRYLAGWHSWFCLLLQLLSFIYQGSSFDC